MKLLDVHEEIIWENNEFALVLIEQYGTKPLKVALKGKSGKLIKDIGKLASRGIQKAGILGAFASDYLKRYKTLKSASHRSIAFYARDVQEKRAYEKVIKHLTKDGQYKVIRSFPYAGGGKMWEIR